ncbi:MAG: hypothetical protein U0992_21680 [Planctomycetaceae bacterium]
MTVIPTWALLVVFHAVVITTGALLLTACLRSRPALQHAVGVLGLGLLLASPLLALVLPPPWLWKSEPVIAAAQVHITSLPATLDSVPELVASHRTATPEMAIVTLGHEIDATENPVVTRSEAPPPAADAPRLSNRGPAIFTAIRNHLPQIGFAAGVV